MINWGSRSKEEIERDYEAIRIRVYDWKKAFEVSKCIRSYDITRSLRIFGCTFEYQREKLGWIRNTAKSIYNGSMLRYLFRNTGIKFVLSSGFLVLELKIAGLTLSIVDRGLISWAERSVHFKYYKEQMERCNPRDKSVKVLYGIHRRRR